MKSFCKLMPCLLAGGVALLVSTIPLDRALAHADYERSEPPAGSVTAEAPMHVHIYFTQELFRRQGTNGIEVYNADGVRVDQDDPTIDDDNRRLMSVSLEPELPDGLYTVRWFSLSAEDGHEGEGEFTFTVGAAETTTNTVAVTATDSVTATDAITATGVTTGEAEATETATTTVPGEPTVATAPPWAPAAPTPAPASSGIPCLGGVAPLGLALSLAWIGRQRTKRSLC